MSTSETTRPRRTKHYLPLESNPEVFTQLIQNLGISTLEFQDVYSLDEPELLALLPRPAHALVLVFPTSEAHEKHKKAVEESRKVYEGKGEDEEVVWFRQTIGNACGLYGILHAVSNGNARDHIGESFYEYNHVGLDSGAINVLLEWYRRWQ
jgi:ubiquitin carboxyl-terminal hydrolase L3